VAFGIPPTSDTQLSLVGQITHCEVDGRLLDLWTIVQQGLTDSVVIWALHL
jgi:hypothetical protein